VADLPRLIESHLAAAREDEHGRSTELLLHDGPLRQTIIALTAGNELSEHNPPDAASIQVLLGRVEVTGLEPAVLAPGRLEIFRHERHAVRAVEDAVFLLTTVTGVGQTPEPRRAR
jgi:quercetin dioxygenase-like cupin family protein